MRYRPLASAGLVAALVLALEAACRTGLIRKSTLIAPSEMVASLREILSSGTYSHAILLTLGTVATASIISVAAGFAAGVAIHTRTFFRRGIEPYLASYYAVPTFIFYPVFVVLFGVGSGAIVAIAVMLAVVAMVTATLNGLDRIPRVLTRTATMLRMPRLRAAMLVQLPATTPYLFTGIRLCIAYSFIGVIASEFILSGDGLGYAIAYAYNNFENRTMYGLMLLIVIVVTVANSSLDLLDRRLQARLRR